MPNNTVSVPEMKVLYESTYKELFGTLPAATKQRVLDAIADPTINDPRVTEFVQRVINKAEGKEWDIINGDPNNKKLKKEVDAKTSSP
jgi:hypothetical protein